MNSFVVIGLGRFGSEIAKRLYSLGKDVLAVDNNSELVNNIADKVTRAVVADSKDIEVLKSLGVAECDCAIVAIGSDFATSVLTTMHLKKLNIKKIVCKAHDDTHREILNKLGADEIIFPEREIAVKTANVFVSPNILEQIELSDEYGIVECTAPVSWCGKSLKELNVRTKYNVNVIAVKEGGSVNVSPGADYLIKQTDILIMLGDYDDLDKVTNIK